MASTNSILESSLSLLVNVEIDAEDARIDALTITNPKSRWDSNDLDHWIKKRLEIPLHRFDVGSIVWGAGHYFEACIARARIFAYLYKRYNRGFDATSPELTGKNHDLSGRESLELSPYLHETQLLIQPSNENGTTKSNSTQTDSKRKQVLVTYEIDLTWTGDVVSQVDICLTGESAKSQQGVKELFVKLLATQGVVKAFDAVWGVLGWDLSSASIESSGKRPGRPRKRAVS